MGREKPTENGILLINLRFRGLLAQKPRFVSQFWANWGVKDGGQGRIRTSVARKERQIYSLLPLTTRPPVRFAQTPAIARTATENLVHGGDAGTEAQRSV